MEEKSKHNKKTIIVLCLFVALLFMAIGAISYAMFSASLSGTKENKLRTGYVSLSCTETNFELQNTKPLTDAQGIALQNNSATCTLTSTMTGEMLLGYDVALYDVDSLTPSDSLGTSNVKIQVSKSIDSASAVYVQGTSTTGVLVSSLASSGGQYDTSITGYKLDSATLAGNHSILYTIKGWASSGGDGTVANTNTDGYCSDSTKTTKAACEAANGIWGYNQETSQNGGSFSFKIKIGAAQALS